MTFKTDISFLVINNTKPLYYIFTVCMSDIRSSLKILIYSFNSDEAMMP